LTLLHAPPAGRTGPMPSLIAVAASTVWPSTFTEWATAKFFLRAFLVSNVVAFMPSGANTRVRIASS